MTTLSREDVRLPKLTEEDDIESYLTTFERMMAGYEIRRERWAFKLAPQLTGFRCYKAKIEEVKKPAVARSRTQDTSGLSRQCSTMDNQVCD